MEVPHSIRPSRGCHLEGGQGKRSPGGGVEKRVLLGDNSQQQGWESLGQRAPMDGISLGPYLSRLYLING